VRGVLWEMFCLKSGHRGRGGFVVIASGLFSVGGWFEGGLIGL
jgi:hypothetical protein